MGQARGKKCSVLGIAEFYVDMWHLMVRDTYHRGEVKREGMVGTTLQAFHKLSLGVSLKYLVQEGFSNHQSFRMY